MMYIDFNVGNETYKLRLSTRAIVTLEKQIGCNPLMIFGKGDTMPPVATMIQILHAAMQQYNHGISLDDTYTIFDKWVEDGNAVTDFVQVIVELYKVSGLIKQGTTEKN